MDPDHTRTSSRFLESDQTPAVLTSFRTLSDEDASGHIGAVDPLSLKSGGGLEENVELDSDPCLVQVIRVETYIDDEEDATSIQERSGDEVASEEPPHCKKMFFFSLVFQ